MKRYVALFSVTSLLIAGIMLAKSLWQSSGTVVSVYEVKTKEVQETVTCSGRVEAADSEDVYVSVPCVADEVYVNVGDEVGKGDVLFSVDVESTKAVIAAAAGISSSMVPDEQIVKTVKAPVSGEVKSINVSAGSTLDSDSPCAVIASSDALQVKVAINENYIKNIQIGQPAVVSGTAFSADGYKGVVSYIAGSARQQYSGSVNVTVVDAIITLSEKDESLKPGLSAKSKIIIGSQSKGIVIPYEYVMQNEDNEEYVYLYKDDCAVQCVISTGKELSDGLEVLSGLSAGDKVIQTPESIQKSGERVILQGSERE